MNSCHGLRPARPDSTNDAEKLKSLSFAVHECNLEMKERDERRREAEDKVRCRPGTDLMGF